MWSYDYCTVCDKQCPLGAMYCSDSCRAREIKESAEQCNCSDHDIFKYCHVHSKSRVASQRDSLSTSPCPGLEANDMSTPRTFSSGASGIMSTSASATTSATNSTVALSTKPQPISIANSNAFLYASPLLVPISADPISPPLSPLLMSQTEVEAEADTDDSDMLDLNTKAYTTHLNSNQRYYSKYSRDSQAPRIVSHTEDIHLDSSHNYRRWLTAL